MDVDIDPGRIQGLTPHSFRDVSQESLKGGLEGWSHYQLQIVQVSHRLAESVQWRLAKLHLRVFAREREQATLEPRDFFILSDKAIVWRESHQDFEGLMLAARVPEQSLGPFAL